MKKYYGIKDGGNPFEAAPTNVMQPLIRKLAAQIAGTAADGRASILYWPCGSDSSQVQIVGHIDPHQASTTPIAGPAKLTWGKMTRLAPALRHLAEELFPSTQQGLALILAPGRIDDIAEVEGYCRGLAQQVATGGRLPIKFVLLFLGDKVEAELRTSMDRLAAQCAVRDPRGREAALLEYRMTPGLTDVEAAVVAVLARECR
jgi:hypothetical protein